MNQPKKLIYKGDIEVAVTAERNVGKTTIINICREALKQQGFVIKYNPRDVFGTTTPLTEKFRVFGDRRKTERRK